MALLDFIPLSILPLSALLHWTGCYLIPAHPPVIDTTLLTPNPLFGALPLRCAWLPPCLSSYNSLPASHPPFLAHLYWDALFSTVVCAFRPGLVLFYFFPCSSITFWVLFPFHQEHQTCFSSLAGNCSPVYPNISFPFKSRLVSQLSIISFHLC